MAFSPKGTEIHWIQYIFWCMSCTMPILSLTRNFSVVYFRREVSGAGLTGRGDVVVGRGDSRSQPPSTVMESTGDLLVPDSIRITIYYSFTRHKSGFTLTTTVHGTKSLRNTEEHGSVTTVHSAESLRSMDLPAQYMVPNPSETRIYQHSTWC